jgi:hypothetical protein
MAVRVTVDVAVGATVRVGEGVRDAAGLAERVA